MLKMKFSDKKGSELLWENVTYLIVNILFFGILAVFIANTGSGIDDYQKVYARQVGLMVDMADSGMNITYDASEIVKRAMSNKIDYNEVIKFDNINKEVIIKLGSGQGYKFQYMSDVNITSKIENKNDYYLLTMELK